MKHLNTAQKQEMVAWNITTKKKKKKETEQLDKQTAQSVNRL